MIFAREAREKFLPYYIITLKNQQFAAMLLLFWCAIILCYALMTAELHIGAIESAEQCYQQYLGCIYWILYWIIKILLKKWGG